MSWVVDTCLLIDVLEDDSAFGESSARLLDNAASDGLLVCPVSYAELAPAFAGDLHRQNEFLDAIGVAYANHYRLFYNAALAVLVATFRSVSRRLQRVRAHAA